MTSVEAIHQTCGCTKALYIHSTKVLSPSDDLILRPTLLVLLCDMYHRIFIASHLMEMLVLFTSLQNIVSLIVVVLPVSKARMSYVHIMGKLVLWT